MTNRDAKLRRVEDIVRRVEALPGVRATFASNFVPLSGGGGGGTVIVEGRAVQKGEEKGISVIARHSAFQLDARLADHTRARLHRRRRLVHSPVAMINTQMKASSGRQAM